MWRGLTLVFTAPTLPREIQRRTGLTIRNVIRQLRTLRLATIAFTGAITTLRPRIEPDRQTIIEALTGAY